MPLRVTITAIAANAVPASTKLNIQNAYQKSITVRGLYPQLDWTHATGYHVWRS